MCVYTQVLAIFKSLYTEIYSTYYHFDCITLRLIAVYMCVCLLLFFPPFQSLFSLSMCVSFFLCLYMENPKSTSPHHLVLLLYEHHLISHFLHFNQLSHIISLLYNYCIPIIQFSTMGSMKVHQFARGFWEHEPSLTLGCKRLRPLAPKLANTDTSGVTAFDLKSFIRPESGPRKLGSSEDKDKRDPPQVLINAILTCPPPILHAIIQYHCFMHVVFSTKNEYHGPLRSAILDIVQISN